MENFRHQEANLLHKLNGIAGVTTPYYYLSRGNNSKTNLNVFSFEIIAKKSIYFAEFISAPYFTLNSSDFDEIFEAF